MPNAWFACRGSSGGWNGDRLVAVAVNALPAFAQTRFRLRGVCYDGMAGFVVAGSIARSLGRVSSRHLNAAHTSYPSFGPLMSFLLSPRPNRIHPFRKPRCWTNC